MLKSCKTILTLNFELVFTKKTFKNDDCVCRSQNKKSLTYSVVYKWITFVWDFLDMNINLRNLIENGKSHSHGLESLSRYCKTHLL